MAIQKPWDSCTVLSSQRVTNQTNQLTSPCFATTSRQSIFKYLPLTDLQVLDFYVDDDDDEVKCLHSQTMQQVKNWCKTITFSVEVFWCVEVIVTKQSSWTVIEILRQEILEEQFWLNWNDEKMQITAIAGNAREHLSHQFKCMYGFEFIILCFILFTGTIKSMEVLGNILWDFYENYPIRDCEITNLEK